jgi:hypothetical protein
MTNNKDNNFTKKFGVHNTFKVIEDWFERLWSDVYTYLYYMKVCV